MPKPKKRNPLVFHPLMRKGGVHEKSGKAKRQAQKQQTRRQLAETN